MPETVAIRRHKPTLKAPAIDPMRPSRSADELADSPTKINVTGVDFFYGPKQALFGIDLVVPEKCVTALTRP